MEVLERIDGTHILGAFAIGILAGVAAFVLDTYVIARVEPMIGVTPGSL